MLAHTILTFRVQGASEGRKIIMSKSDDLISRKAVIDAHYEYCNKHPDAGFPVWSLKILEDLPSAQPEIVRCKDCKHYIKSESYCDYLGITISDYDFCSFAERGTDGN